MATNPRGNRSGSGTPAEKSLVWRRNTLIHEVCSWGSIDAERIRGAIDAITKAGGAVMCGITSDGGAYSIVVLHRDQKLKEYPHTTAEMHDLLSQLTEDFTDFIL